MPVDDHPVHDTTKIGADYRYGCHNRDAYKDAYSAPNRQAGTDGYKPTFWMERIRIPFRMSRDCVTARTGQAATDPYCADCKWSKPIKARKK